MMKNKNYTKNDFDTAIDNKLTSSEWSLKVTRELFKRVHTNKKNRFPNIASAAFPLAAAALFVVVLFLGNSRKETASTELYLANLAGIEVNHTDTAGRVEQRLTEYIDNSIFFR